MSNDKGPTEEPALITTEESPQGVKKMAAVEEAGWKAVQEIAESGGELPACYIVREEDRPTDAAPPSTPVPIIDLSRLFQPGGDDEVDKLRSALQSWGLFQAIGHDMSSSFLNELHDIATKFFQLPMEVKQKYSNLQFGTDFPQGYGNDHATTKDQIATWTDRLLLFVQPEDQRKVELWPEEPSTFRDVTQEFTMKCKKVFEHVLKSMAKLLELNEDYFSNQFVERATVLIRFSYYPCCSRPDLVFGLKPHSDNSAITILLSDKDVEGLQVLKDGDWVKIPTIPHALLVNLGDEMEIMSNGIFKSPVHRVMTNSEKERVSVAVFYQLDPEKELGPADGLLDEMRPRLYKTMKTKDYLEVFYQNYAKGKRTIDWAKI